MIDGMTEVVQMPKNVTHAKKRLMWENLRGHYFGGLVNRKTSAKYDFANNKA